MGKLTLRQDNNAKTLSFNLLDNNGLITTAIYKELKQHLATQDMVRLSLHTEAKDLTQSMIIAITNNAIIQQHKNQFKDKIYHIIEGEIEFDLLGGEKILAKTNEIFKLGKDTFASIKSITDISIYNEIVSGPFQKADTIYKK